MFLVLENVRLIMDCQEKQLQFVFIKNWWKNNFYPISRRLVIFRIFSNYGNVFSEQFHVKKYIWDIFFAKFQFSKFFCTFLFFSPNFWLEYRVRNLLKFFVWLNIFSLFCYIIWIQNTFKATKIKFNINFWITLLNRWS